MAPVNSKAVPCVYLASSVCRSLQCLISHLTQGGKGGLLFRLTCSVVLCGGRSTANKHRWHVWGLLAVSGPHWDCPRSAHSVCFPSLHYSGFRLFCKVWALGCVHFPGLSLSGSGSQVLHKGADSVRPAFCSFRVGAAQETRCLASALSSGAVRLITSLSQLLGFQEHPSPVCCMSLLGSLFLAATLPADVNCPESQEVFG